MLAFILLAIFALHYTSPTKVREMVLKFGANAVNGRLEVGDARLQVFRGAQFRNVRLYRRDQSEPDIDIERVRCDWNPAAFLHGDIEPRRVVLVEPTIRLLIDEHRHTNMEDLFAKESSDDPGAFGDLMRYERYFSEGIFAESLKFVWHAPVLFGDDRTRVFTGMDIQMHRPSETLNRWNISALIRGAPLEGMRVEGWMDFTPKKERISYRGEVEELDIRPEMLIYLPAEIRAYLLRFALKGKLSASTRIDYRRGEPMTYAVEVRLHNLDARLRPRDLEIRSLGARVRFDSVGFSCDDVSGIMWNGALSGGAAGRPDVPTTAWLKIEQADLARLAKEARITERGLRGLLNLSMRFQIPKDDPLKWTAEETMEVRKAYLAEMPMFARAFRLLKFQFPRGEVFDQGEIARAEHGVGRRGALAKGDEADDGVVDFGE